MLWHIYPMESFMLRLANLLGLFKMNWFDLTESHILMISLKVIKLECVYTFKYLGNDLFFFPTKQYDSTVIFSSLFPPFQWSFFSWRLSSWVAFCTQQAFVLVCYIPHNPHYSLYQHWYSDKAGSLDCDPPVILSM